MRVGITGASGLIGTALSAALEADGDEVVRFVRSAPAGPGEARWDPATGEVDQDALSSCAAVVHLAGAGIGDRRWTPQYRDEVMRSRVSGTTAISIAMARLRHGPRILLSGSAVGWYGDTGDREVDEAGPAGDGFLAEVCLAWEAATRAASEAGIRVAHLRTGIVLSSRGGALARQLPIFRLGVGGRLGSGRQYLSWISLADEVGAIRHLLTRDDVAGAVNLTGPAAVTNAAFTAALGHALHRPTVLVVPGFALRAVLGGFADEGVLAGQRVAPRVLQAGGYRYRHTTVEAALAAAMAGD